MSSNANKRKRDKQALKKEVKSKNWKVMAYIIALISIDAMVAAGFMVAARSVFGGPNLLNILATISTGLIAFFLTLIVLFVIYQLDKSAGRLKRRISIFEIDPQGGGDE